MLLFIKNPLKIPTLTSRELNGVVERGAKREINAGGRCQVLVVIHATHTKKYELKML